MPSVSLTQHATFVLAFHIISPLLKPAHFNLKLTFSLIFGLKNLLQFSFLFCQFFLKLVL